MKKTLVVVVMAMTLGLCSMVKASNLVDVPSGHWAADAVNRLSDLGLVVGYPDGTYKGGQAMTRYEYAMIVDRLVKWADDKFCTKDGCKGTVTTVDGVKVDTSGFASNADLEEVKAIIKKLSAEFKDELAALNQKVDVLDGRVGTLETTVKNLPMSKIKVDGAIRQRIDVLDTDLTPGNLSTVLTNLHGLGAITSLNAGYEIVPSISFSDAVATDDVYYTIGLKQHIANQAYLGPIASAANNRQLDINEAYVALDMTKSVRELDELKITSGYQKVVFGPFGGLVDNRGADSQAGVKVDVSKDIVSLTGFGALASATGNGAGLGTSSKDPYIAGRLGLNFSSVKVGFNVLPNGFLKEKAWGADVDAKLLKDSPFLKAIRAEYFKITDTTAGASPAVTADDNSLIVGLDVYQSKKAGLTVSYANIPAVPVLTGVDSTWLTEYDTACPMGLDVSGGACVNYDSGNVMFPAGFKGLGVQASYTVLGDVELGGEAIFGDFAGGTIPAAVNANLAGVSAKGKSYPGYGTLSLAKPINKSSKFRVEYTQQGKDPVMLSRVRGELLINF